MPVDHFADTPPGPTGRGWGLVLGGGGSVGIAYLSGVLHGLAEAGLDLRSADLVVGTSAGALAGAMLRRGAAPQDLLKLAEVPSHGDTDPRRHFEPAWRTPHELWRRSLGAGAVAARSYLRAPLPMPSPWMEATFPGGLFRPRGNRMPELLGDAWPADPLWLMATDLASGRRVPLGRDPADHRHPLHAAVMASCAVPGFYEPVRLGRRLLVDGGVRSSASIDYAVRYGCDRLIAVVPLGHEPPGRPRLSHRLVRWNAMAATRRELRRAGDRARDVLVIQPAAEDLALHGTNFLRSDGNDEVAERARHRTRELVADEQVRRFLDEARDLGSRRSDGRGG